MVNVWHASALIFVPFLSWHCFPYQRNHGNSNLSFTFLYLHLFRNAKIPRMVVKLTSVSTIIYHRTNPTANENLDTNLLKYVTCFWNVYDIIFCINMWDLYLNTSWRAQYLTMDRDISIWYCDISIIILGNKHVVLCYKYNNLGT